MTREEREQARIFLDQRLSLQTARLGLQILEGLEAAEAKLAEVHRAWHGAEDHLEDERRHRDAAEAKLAEAERKLRAAQSANAKLLGERAAAESREKVLREALLLFAGRVGNCPECSAVMGRTEAERRRDEEYDAELVRDGAPALRLGVHAPACSIGAALGARKERA